MGELVWASSEIRIDGEPMEASEVKYVQHLTPRRYAPPIVEHTCKMELSEVGVDALISALEAKKGDDPHWTGAKVDVVLTSSDDVLRDETTCRQCVVTEMRKVGSEYELVMDVCGEVSITTRYTDRFLDCARRIARHARRCWRGNPRKRARSAARRILETEVLTNGW